MQRSRIFITCCICALLASCSGNSAKQGVESVTPYGYRMIKHLEGDGEGPATTKVAFFSIYMYEGDQIITSSVKQGRLGKMHFKDYENEKRPQAWADALYQMKVGDSVSVFMPVDSFEVKPRSISPETQVVRYDIMLKEIITHLEYETRYQARKIEEEEARKKVANDSKVWLEKSKQLIEDVKAGKVLPEKLNEEGLAVVIHEKGEGALPVSGKNISVEYYGLLKSDGSSFDNSYERRRPFSFNIGLGRVIKGWDEALMQLPEGTKATIFVPWTQAYGEAGSPPKIPSRADLVFFVDVTRVQTTN